MMEIPKDRIPRVRRRGQNLYPKSQSHDERSAALHCTITSCVRSCLRLTVLLKLNLNIPNVLAEGFGVPQLVQLVQSDMRKPSRKSNAVWLGVERFSSRDGCRTLSNSRKPHSST